MTLTHCYGKASMRRPWVGYGSHTRNTPYEYP